MSLVKLLVVLLDTVLGTWLRWRPVARRRLLVVERGWYDLAVDPHRYRLPRSFTPLVAALGVLVPKADVTVLLTGDPDAFHRRKPEIGVVEVARQLVAWQHYARRAGRRVVELNTVSDPVATSAATLAAVLPGGPRWLRVPAAPRRLDLRATGPGPALQIYRPHRLAARAVTGVNAPLLRAGLARRVAPPSIPALDELVSRAERSAYQLVAFRSSATDRWIVGVADAAGLHTVVKAGRDDAGLAREVAALSRLRSTATVMIPTIIGEERSDGWHAVALAAVPAEGEPPDVERVASLTTALTRGALGEPVVHGDLAPWNLAVDGQRVVVWDWEEAELGVARPLHDLSHYLVRSGTLLGTVDPSEAAGLLTTTNGPGARHLLALGVAVTDASRLVRAYLERTEPATAKERIFRSKLAAALH